MIYDVRMRFTVTRHCLVEADSEEEAINKANNCDFIEEGPDSDVHDWDAETARLAE
jgi:hypothetical protein